MAAAAAAVLQTSGADERGYELGFVGKCEGEEDQAWLRSPAFPSKVGGRPVRRRSNSVAHGKSRGKG